MEASSALLARAQALFDVRRYDEALEVVGEGLARDSESYALQTMLARTLLLLGRSKEAERAAERAASLGPTESEPHCIRAESLLPLGETNYEADRAAKLACELGPEYPRAFFVRVRTALAIGHIDNAWKAANRVLEILPNASLGHHARGLVLIERKAWRDAEREYRTALGIAPNDPNLLNNHGVALLNLGRETEAIEEFSRAGQLDARRDLYRKNTAAAARRHLGDTRRANHQGVARLAVAIALIVGLVVLADFSPGAFVVAVICLLPAAVLFAAVRRRRRLGRLSNAAQIALEIDERTSGIRARRRRARLRVGLILLGGIACVAVLATLGGGLGSSGSPSTPLPTLSPGQEQCVLAALNGSTAGTLPIGKCSSPSSIP